MPRPISGNALSPTERTRRRRARLAQEAAEAQAEAQRQAQAEREARQALTDEVKATAHVMLDGFARPLLRRSEAEREAWMRLLAHLDRWTGR